MSGEFLGVVRASAWPALFDCALRFEYQTLRGLWTPGSGAQRIGTGWHKATATFDQATIDGNPITIDDAAGVFVDALRDTSEPVEWELPQRDAEYIGIAITERYCRQIAPHRTYQAVELKCEALDIETAYGVVRVTGTTDAIRIDRDGRRGISDRKSGKRAVMKGADFPVASTKGHHLQLGIYTLMVEAESGSRLDAPAEIIGANTSKSNPVVATALVADVRTPLIGNGDKPGLITIAAGMLKTGLFPPNPRSQLCSKRYCAGWGVCPYRSRDLQPDDEPDVTP